MDKKKIKDFLKSNSFAGAMCLSVMAVALALYLAYDNTIGQIEAQSSLPYSDSPVDNEVSGVEKTEETTLSTTPAPESSDAPTNNFVQDTSVKMMPAEGEIINPFSFHELVKSETLGVWKTHDGIDIAVPTGTEVKSAAIGTVVAVRDDPLWGGCVIIDHGNGYVGYYYGLDKELLVKENSKVDAGRVIGKTAVIECEAKLQPHLHFGVKESGEWIDPVEFVSGEG